MRFVGTVIVLASGPSLTQEDVDKTRFLPCIAVNSTWEIAPHSAVVFAADLNWWVSNENLPIDAERVSYSYTAEREYKAAKFDSRIAKPNQYNSGCLAVEYALAQGADRVLMLGMDCSVKHGAHHHKAHPTRNPKAGTCAKWLTQWQRLRDVYPDADIVNCSRHTELDIFPIVDLDEALCGLGFTCAIPHPSVKGYLLPD